MSNMKFDSTTLAYNPATMTLIREDKHCAAVETYSSAAFFNWGLTIVGKKLTLTWNIMSSTEFDTLDTLYQGEGPLVFDPQNGSGKTYNVQIMSLNGEYCAFVNRQNVEMTLLILSEVT